MPFAQSNGITIHYEIHGKGNPVVLISGLGSSLGSWETQIPIYSKRFKVIVLDNRGVGASEVTEPGFGIEDMADDTIGLLDYLNLDYASFIGKSMGGMIAQRIAIKYQRRVNKLVIGCSSSSRDDVGNFILSNSREIATKAGMKVVWSMALFLGYTREYIEKNIDYVKQVQENISEDEEVLKGYLGQIEACERHHSLDEISKIKSDTLIMCGEKDLITSAERSIEMADRIPNCRLERFKDVGHGFWREKQREVDKLVMEFLS